MPQDKTMDGLLQVLTQLQATLKRQQNIVAQTEAKIAALEKAIGVSK